MKTSLHVLLDLLEEDSSGDTLDFIGLVREAYRQKAGRSFSETQLGIDLSRYAAGVFNFGTNLASSPLALFLFAQDLNLYHRGCWVTFVYLRPEYESAIRQLCGLLCGGESKPMQLDFERAARTREALRRVSPLGERERYVHMVDDYLYPGCFMRLNPERERTEGLGALDERWLVGRFLQDSLVAHGHENGGHSFLMHMEAFLSSDIDRFYRLGGGAEEATRTEDDQGIPVLGIPQVREGGQDWRRYMTIADRPASDYQNRYTQDPTAELEILTLKNRQTSWNAQDPTRALSGRLLSADPPIRNIPANWSIRDGYGAQLEEAPPLRSRVLMRQIQDEHAHLARADERTGQIASDLTFNGAYSAMRHGTIGLKSLLAAPWYSNLCIEAQRTCRMRNGLLEVGSNGVLAPPTLSAHPACWLDRYGRRVPDDALTPAEALRP